MSAVKSRAAIAHDFSIEATRPKLAEIEAVAGLIGRGRAVYLGAVPWMVRAEHAEAAALVRRAGTRTSCASHRAAPCRGRRS